MTFTISAGNPAPLAKQALKYRLYHRGGMLEEYLQDVVKDPKGQTIAVLRGSGGAFHGLCLIAKCNAIMAYVQPQMRGHGWGERLVQAALSVDGRWRQNVYAGPGENFFKSVNFWRKCRIVCHGPGIGISVSITEAKQLVENGQALAFRAAENVSIDTYEALYLRGLYDDSSTDKQDGLKGLLTAIWNENLMPFDYVLYHMDSIQLLLSFAVARERNSGKESVLELQLYVTREMRRQGLGQAIIDRVKKELPNRRIVAHYTPNAVGLLTRNQIEDIKTHTLDPWTIASPIITKRNDHAKH